ncbi:MAG: hypothetical protein EBU01_10545, partial [Crocinitomicaceae bacterium]|nr:hypothetical protein [Crocinitomicaceae bacterium]
MAKIRKQDALDYHSSGKPGKIEVVPTKPYASQRDLSLAYSPGVAEPCLKIAENKDDVYKYTAKANLVAVISNGTAVLGLGDIGPEASKPVMEGKGLLFKIFADIDVFDIEVDAKDPELFIQTVKAIAPTFGGINLEDIKAPEAFEIERRLKEELDIPVMHDDQHGTAIISSAALLNALELAEKKIEDVKIVVSGAGPSALACAKLYNSLGARLENIFMYDSKGLISKNRTDLDSIKQFFANHTEDIPFAKAFENADVFLGLSRAGLVSKDMIAVMAKDPIVFALANPEPEISYKDATSVRKDIILATGRSDHPNQVNNVLGFPFIFRGALDVRATTINEEMKLAAVNAIATLAKETIPEEVIEAYNEKNISFGREQLIPKPLDPRLIYYVAPAVAKAAMDSGVAKNPISDWDEYENQLKNRLGLNNKLVRNITSKAQRNPKTVVFAEADNIKILKAAQIAFDEGVAIPVLLGKKNRIHKLIEEYSIELPDVLIIDPKLEEEEKRRITYGKAFFEKRKRKAATGASNMKIVNLTQNPDNSFNVLIKGNRGMTYEVLFSEQSITCSCPDFQKHTVKPICKHMFKLICISENHDIFNNSMLLTDLMNPQYLARILESTLRIIDVKKMERYGGPQNQISIERDECCPICYGDFDLDISQCFKCKHVFHTNCVSLSWNSGSYNTRGKCPMCRETNSFPNIQGGNGNYDPWEIYNFPAPQPAPQQPQDEFVQENEH